MIFIRENPEKRIAVQMDLRQAAFLLWERRNLC